jgi:ligand-binding sensor domain-containing protein
VKGTSVYEVNPNGVTQVYTSAYHITDLASGANYFYMGFPKQVLQFNVNFVQTGTFTVTSQYDFNLTAITASAGKLYIGTENYGVLVTPDQPPGNYTGIYPGSPLMNRVFAADIYGGYIWVVHGLYNESYNPNPIVHYGISRYVNGRWQNIPYDAFHEPNLTDVKINPDDTSTVFVASYHKGLLEFRNGTLYRKYDHTNSSISIPVLNGNPYHSFRISPVIFDDQNRLWAYQSIVNHPLHRYDLQGHWQSFALGTLIDDPIDDNVGTSAMAFDREGNLWLGTYSLGLVGLDPESGNAVSLTAGNGIPYEGHFFNTTAVAIDKKNVLWVGTMVGLRILRNPERAFTDPDIQLEKIIIELEDLEGQDNQGVELLLNTEITEIVVDGANNKWIGTNNAGVFYFSEDGRETIYHFTAENSPLPGNSIFDIAVDPVTGLVLFCTENGLIGFKGDASEARNDLSDAYVYPNPVITKRHDHLIVRNLMSDINIKITDIEGNLVYETRSEGGTVRWDLKNFGGKKVASGVYLLLLTDNEGENTKVLKVLIIN